MPATELDLPLRIVVVKPPPGVTFALQRGKGELSSATTATGADLAFELSVRVRSNEDGSPNFLGSFAQGPRGGRFIYVNSGALAGQTDSRWTRRAKVHLAGITRNLINRSTAIRNGILEARIAGTGKDGGPACATVPLLDGGWKVVGR